MIYPHVVDRYRIIQKLVRLEREGHWNSDIRQRGLGQQALARAARVSQATVSNIENLEISVENSRRRVSRAELLKVLAWGLKLDQGRIDALLWFYDGCPLAGEEVHTIARKGLRVVPEQYREVELRAIILDWIEELLQHPRYLEAEGSSQIIAIGNSQNNQYAVKELLAVESRPGQRMLEMRYPSFMSLSPRAYPAGTGADGFVAQFRSLNDLRLSQLQHYGERSIHHTYCIENYIDKGPEALGRNHRRAQIERWIELLESGRHPHYQVRLSDEPIRFELNLKTGSPVIMGTMVNENAPWEVFASKAQWIRVLDEHSALKLLLQFERDWDRAICPYGTNARVAKFLRALLDRSP